MRRLIKDKGVLLLNDQIIDHAVPGSLCGKGVPIGNLTSQHYANLYLGELDHFLKDQLRVPGYLRYMDDFICFSDDKGYLNRLLLEIRNFLNQRLRLQLKEKVVRIAPVTEGVPFLGLRIFPNLTRIQRPNLVRARRKIRDKEQAFKNGFITELELIQSVNSIIAHISHADSMSLRRKEFESSLVLA